MPLDGKTLTQSQPLVSIGVEATIQYYLTRRLFAEAGIGFISRKLNTNVFLDQAVLPPPRQSLTSELLVTKSVSLRTIQLPLNIGYNIVTKQKINLFLHAGISGNFLLNTDYGFDGSQYGGSYKKNYWQGYSANIGLGADYTISKRLKATGRIGYSIINTVKDDEYLYSQDEYVIPLPHEYLRLSLGLRMRL